MIFLVLLFVQDYSVELLTVDLAVTRIYKTHLGNPDRGKTTDILVGEIKNLGNVSYPGGARAVLYCRLKNNAPLKPFKTARIPRLDPNRTFTMQVIPPNNANQQTMYFLKIMSKTQDSNSRNDFAILKPKKN